MLLATASPVLNAHIQRWAGGAGAVDEGGRKCIRVCVHPDEAQAAEDVLRFVYCGKLPPGAETVDVRHRFRMFVVADRLGVAPVRDAVLANAKPSSVEDVNFVLGEAQQLAPSLWSHPITGALRIASATHLMHAFCDVSNVIRKNVEAFGGLCFEAVLAFARCDALRVQSETDVLVLLSAWVRANAAEMVDADKRVMLAALLRLEHLSSAYFVNLASLAPWAAPGAREMARLTYARLRGAGSPPVPDMYAQRRCVVKAGVRIVWSVLKAELERMFDAAAACSEADVYVTWSSTVFYYHGYTWHVGIKLDRARGVFTVQLRARLPDALLVPGACVVFADLTCVAVCGLGDDEITDRYVAHATGSAQVTLDAAVDSVSVPARGVDDMLPFFVDGVMSVRVWVRMCD